MTYSIIMLVAVLNVVMLNIVVPFYLDQPSLIFLSIISTMPNNPSLSLYWSIPIHLWGHGKLVALDSIIEEPC